MEDRITAWIGVYANLIIATMAAEKPFFWFWISCAIFWLAVYCVLVFKKNQP